MLTLGLTFPNFFIFQDACAGPPCRAACACAFWAPSACPRVAFVWLGSMRFACIWNSTFCSSFFSIQSCMYAPCTRSFIGGLNPVRRCSSFVRLELARPYRKSGFSSEGRCDASCVWALIVPSGIGFFARKLFCSDDFVRPTIVACLFIAM